MNRFLIVIGAISVIFLMVSNTTAVTKVNGEPVMKNISNVKQQVTLLEEKSKCYIEKLSFLDSNILPKNIFDFILAILRAIINKTIVFINSLTVFIQDVMQLVSALIGAVKNLINVILQFIDLIIGPFTSGSTAFNLDLTQSTTT